MDKNLHENIIDLNKTVDKPRCDLTMWLIFVVVKNICFYWYSSSSYLLTKFVVLGLNKAIRNKTNKTKKKTDFFIINFYKVDKGK